MTIGTTMPFASAKRVAATNTCLRHCWFETREPNARAINPPAVVHQAISKKPSPPAVNLRHRLCRRVIHSIRAVPNHLADRRTLTASQRTSAVGNQRQSVDEARGAIEPRETRGGHAPRAAINKGWAK